MPLSRAVNKSLQHQINFFEGIFVRAIFVKAIFSIGVDGDLGSQLQRWRRPLPDPEVCPDGCTLLKVGHSPIDVRVIVSPHIFCLELNPVLSSSLVSLSLSLLLKEKFL